MKIKVLGLWSFVGCALLAGCAPGAELWVPREADLTPPRLLDCRRDAEGKLILSFDEVVEQLKVDFPEGGGEVDPESGMERRLTLATQPGPGVEWVLSAEASDASGNSATFLFSVFGVNPRLAGVRLNEVSIQGSSNHPDFVELFVTQSGDLAGLVVALGSIELGDPFYVFPPCEVRVGDFILLHARPTGAPSEKNETLGKWESGSPDASPGAWDFWWRGGKGLSGTTGMVVVKDSQRGKVLDGLLYSNRTSASDEDFGGWGSRANQQRALWLVGEGGWVSDEAQILPEEAVSSEGVTATRTLNRRATGTGTRAWFIGASGTKSPGAANTTQAHAPRP